MKTLKGKEGLCFLGKTLELEYGDLLMSVTIDVGPRIIHFSRRLGQNIMFNDLNDEVSKDVSKYFGEGNIWHLYGGHRIWASPEGETTYIPDNDPVPYEIKGNSVEFFPRAWPKVGLQSSLKISFLGDNKVSVSMSLTNTGDPKKIALWALTVLKPGGKMEAYLPKKDTGYLPNRNLVMWPYASISDKRFSFSDDKLTVQSNDRASNPFKVGFYTDKGKIIYTLGKETFTKTFEVKEGEYPDMNCNVETYTSKLIHEVETLSPLVSIGKGDTIYHEEIWTLERA